MKPSGLVKASALRPGGALRTSSEAYPSAAQPPAAVPRDTAADDVLARERAHRAQHEEPDRLRAQAREEGLAQARQEAAAQAREAVQSQLVRLGELMVSMESAWQSERERIEDQLADFAFVAVNRLLADALRDPAAAMAAVRSALSACQGWGALTLEVHPSDVALVKASLALQPPGEPAPVEVVASAGVSVGGCRVCGTEGQLDARLEVQLAALHAELAETRAQRGQA